jgi:hypothetical protein
MPRHITLPNDRNVSLGTYVKAWRTLKTLPPQAPVKGFSFIYDTAGQILREIRHGIHDRINRHLTHPSGRDSIADLQCDRHLIEAALHRRTFRSGTGLLRTRHLRRRYPHLNQRTLEA